MSTAQNKDFSVSSFDAFGIVLETVTTQSNSHLRLRSLTPNTLTDFQVTPESNRIGEWNSTLSIVLTLSSDLPCQSDLSGCVVTLDVPRIGNEIYPDESMLNADELRCE